MNVEKPVQWKPTNKQRWWRMILGKKGFEKIMELQDNKQHFLPDKITRKHGKN